MRKITIRAGTMGLSYLFFTRPKKKKKKLETLFAKDHKNLFRVPPKRFDSRWLVIEAGGYCVQRFANSRRLKVCFKLISTRDKCSFSQNSTEKAVSC